MLRVRAYEPEYAVHLPAAQNPLVVYSYFIFREVNVSASIGAPPLSIASIKMWQLSPTVVITGKEASVVVVSLALAAENDKAVSVPMVTDPAQSVCPATEDNVTLHLKGTTGNVPVNVNVAELIASYSL